MSALDAVILNKVTKLEKASEGVPASTAFTTMPMIEMGPAQIYIKAANYAYVANTADFYEKISSDTSTTLQSSAQLVPVKNTLEQVLVDIVGSGVLTNVKTHATNTASTHTIRVEIDGAAPIVYALRLPASTSLIIGVLSPWAPSSTYTGIGSTSDKGFEGASFTMMAPIQAIQLSSYGLKFATSLRITVQNSVGFAGAPSNKAVALYTTYIPKGI